jgi:hypothetical protein
VPQREHLLGVDAIFVEQALVQGVKDLEVVALLLGAIYRAATRANLSRGRDERGRLRSCSRFTASLA